MLKVSGRTSTKIGLASNQAMTSALAAKVKDGTNTASPGLRPLAISASPQGVGAVGTGQHVPSAAEFRKLALKLSDLGAEDEPAVFEHALDRQFDSAADTRALGLQINEFDRCGRARCQSRGVGHQAISSMRSGPTSR
jgi:hypothetical protein